MKKIKKKNKILESSRHKYVDKDELKRGYHNAVFHKIHVKLHLEALKRIKNLKKDKK